MAVFTVSAWTASTQQTGYEAHNLGDAYINAGDVGTDARWASTATGAPQWAYADLGTAQTAVWYQLGPGNYQSNQDPTAWTFEGSNDASAWTTLDTKSSQTFPDGATRSFTFTNSTAYRYYRVNVSAINGTSTLSLSYMAVGSGTPPSTLFGWKNRVGAVGGDFTLGVVFKPTTGGQITQLAFLPTGSGTTPVTLYVYDTTRTAIASATVTPAGNSIWVVANITPVTLTSGVEYMIAGRSSQHGTVAGTIGSGETNGDLQVIANGSATFDSRSSNPRYESGAAFPINTGSSWYGMSVTFEPSAGSSATATASLTLTGTATPKGVATATGTLTLGATATPNAAATAAATVTLAATGNAGSGTLAATATGALALSGTATPKGVASATGTLVLSGTTASAITATVDAGVGVGPVTLEAGGALPDSDAILAPVACGVEVVARFLPSPVAPPAGVLTEWPLQRQAHLMAALSAANPRYRADIDYTVDRAETGRLHVWVGGQDMTYLRGVPAQFDDYSASRPFESETARIGLPQLKPWDIAGTGDLAALDPDEDPAVEIALVRPDDSVEELWEGFLSLADDRSGTGEDYTFSAEGLFAQAAHQPWNPPPFMEPTDIGWLVADALNGVVARRWGAIPRVTTGIKTRNRGTQAQSVWQYVQDLLSKAWTDDERQWTLSRVAAYTYRIVLKSLVTDTDFTVTKGAPGVDVALSQDQSQRHDCIFGRGIAPDGGVWANWFFPGLDKFLLPLYPMAGFANMSVGTTDADTTTGRGVTDWQRRMRELGFPVTVDGVMNSADTDYVKAIQRKRGITVDGSLGPQTWAATFDNGVTDLDLSAIRLPLAAKPDSEPFLYSANGAQQGANPLFDAKRVRHAMPEVDFGPGVTKAEGRILAQRMLARDSVVGWSGTITLLTDPHETGTTRFEIRPGHNIHVVGHHGGVDLQVSAVSVSGLSVTLTVDSRARDAMTVDAILDRNRDARRDTSARDARYLDKAALNRSDVTQYEAESQAGFVPRVAVNGNSGLWTVLPIFVSQVGVAKIEFTATEPKAEIYVALFEKPITANQVASFAPDPSSDSSGWFENVDDLEQKHGLLEVFGTPDSPGGYWPWEKSDGHALTGRLRDRSSSLYASQYGGFIWVAMFTSVSTWVQGRVFPAVPQ